MTTKSIYSKNQGQLSWRVAGRRRRSAEQTAEQINTSVCASTDGKPDVTIKSLNLRTFWKRLVDELSAEPSEKD